MQNVLTVSALSVKFSDHTVLDNVSFSVKQGEIFALLGGNGAGKSTALKTCIGIIAPSKGDVSVMGRSVLTEVNAIRQDIAYLPESVMLYGHLTGVENIEYFLSLAQVSRSASDIESALERVALQKDAWHRHLSDYSKGMRQKTAIALALLRQAPVLFLDEPTSGLDPSAIAEFNQLISTLAHEGTTVFMVTHDIYGACQVAHRIGLLRNGTIVDMFERHANATISIDEVHAAVTSDAQ